MRLYLICFLILVFLIVLSILSIQFISHIITNTCDDLLSATILYRSGNIDHVLFILENMERHWDENEAILGALLSHREIDTVITAFAELKSLAESKDYDEFFSTAAALQVQLKHIQEMEYPLIQNIF